MTLNIGENIRPVGFETRAGIIDGDYARADHVHSIDPGLFELLANTTDVNLIDNPEFKHSQRGVPVTGINQFVFDRWYVGATGTAVVSHAFSGSTPSTDMPTSGLFTVTTADASIAAGDFLYLQQAIEGYTFARAFFGTTKARPVTISFWVQATLAGTYCVSLRNGGLNRAYVKEFTLAANTWTRVVVTIPGCTDGTWDTTTAASAYLNFSMAVGSTYQGAANSWLTTNTVATSSQVNLAATVSNIYQITQVQMVIGSYDIPFRSKDHVDDLNRCRRFFQRYVDPPLRGVVGGGNNIARGAMTFVVPFRATPTVSATGNALWYDGSVGQTQNALNASYLTTLSAEHDVGFPGATFTTGRAGVLYQSGGSVWSYSAEI